MTAARTHREETKPIVKPSSHDDIKSQTEAFLANGGGVEKIAIGTTGYKSPSERAAERKAGKQQNKIRFGKKARR